MPSVFTAPPALSAPIPPLAPRGSTLPGPVVPLTLRRVVPLAPRHVAPRALLREEEIFATGGGGENTHNHLLSRQSPPAVTMGRATAGQVGTRARDSGRATRAAGPWVRDPRHGTERGSDTEPRDTEPGVAVWGAETSVGPESGDSSPTRAHEAHRRTTSDLPQNYT